MGTALRAAPFLNRLETVLIVLGIDIGSTTSKCVLMNENKEIIAKQLLVAGIGTDGPGQAVEALFSETGLSWEDISFTVATGYGRLTYDRADDQVSELSCHAAGTNYLLPDVRTVIDIGGQDVKVLSIDGNGRLLNFIMNDKCAAGTGRFLDVMAGILKVDIDELGGHALKAETPSSISSTCTVFAESEVISQLARGEDRDRVIAGICESVANKTASLAKRIPIKPELAISGGVSKNDGVIKFLELKMGHKIFRHEDAQFAGAIGAAIHGIKKVNGK